ncbi:hypothetical protein [Catellatospora sp. NPDC049133]|jgi:hypothetical protein
MDSQWELHVDALQLLEAEEADLQIIKCTFTCGGGSCNTSCGVSCYVTQY